MCECSYLVCALAKVQSRVKTFLRSFENRSQNVPLSTPELHYGPIFQLAISETWHEYFYTTMCTLPKAVNAEYCTRT